MRKVLHVISSLKVGGAETVLHRLIVDSRGEKFKHAVIALNPKGAMWQRFIDDGIEVVVLDFKRSPVMSFFRLISLIRKRRPDIVQTWMYHADLLGGLAARLAGNKNVIWGVRGSAIPQSRISATQVVVSICSLMSCYIPKVIICCAESARVAHAEIGYDKSKMFVIPNGYKMDHFNSNPLLRLKTRNSFGFSEDDMVVGIVGRFDPLKDYKNFVHAAAMVASKDNNVKFLMVGRDIHPTNDVLKVWLDESGFGNKFVLAGERSDIPACLDAMNIFCLSSSKEGFPNVVCEAMAMNLPCVVTDSGDAAEIVAGTGLVVAPCNSLALADALEKMIKKSAVERLHLGGLARLRIEKMYSIEIATKRFEKIYNNIIESILL
jgi:glycosyltransferase involved in cell wall biosynthesis